MHMIHNVCTETLYVTQMNVQRHRLYSNILQGRTILRHSSWHKQKNRDTVCTDILQGRTILRHSSWHKQKNRDTVCTDILQGRTILRHSSWHKQKNRDTVCTDILQGRTILRHSSCLCTETQFVTPTKALRHRLLSHILGAHNTATYVVTRMHGVCTERQFVPQTQALRHSFTHIYSRGTQYWVCLNYSNAWRVQWDTVLLKCVPGTHNKIQFVTHMNGVRTETQFLTQMKALPHSLTDMYSTGARYRDIVRDPNE